MSVEMPSSPKSQSESSFIVHPIPPLFDRDSRILILGSFPSPASREAGFFYGHPQNRYWKVLAALFGEEVPAAVPERRSFLLRHHIAAWDVIHSCEITGASDSSVRNVTPNDLSVILDNADIRKIYVNGRLSEQMFRRYTEPVIHRSCIYLPSTSPANAAWSLERLTQAWRVILDQAVVS